MEQITLEALLGHMEDKEVIWDSQPDQPSGLVWWSDYISEQGKSYGCHPSGLP